MAALAALISAESITAFCKLMTATLLWAAASCGNTHRAEQTISGAAANPDGDTFPNLLEYAMGLEPKIADTNMPAIGIGKGFFTLSFPHLKAATDVSLSAETSTDLLNWTTAAPTQIIDNGPIETIVIGQSFPTLTGDNPFISSGGFFRLKALRLP